MKKNLPEQDGLAGGGLDERATLAALEPRLLLAGAPTLEAGVMLQDADQALDVGDVSVPAVVDWNNDGCKDLLVGRRNEGNILVYLNQGTDADPEFNGGSYVLCGGVPIATTYT